MTVRPRCVNGVTSITSRTGRAVPEAQAGRAAASRASGNVFFPRRMTWFGAFEDGDLVAVMGLEYVEDAALIRHAYVLPHRQRQGIATLLHDHIEEQIHKGVERVIAGTYAANHKARHAFESLGYRLSSDPEAILHRYYQIPLDRLQSSVTYEKSRLHDA